MYRIKKILDFYEKRYKRILFNIMKLEKSTGDETLLIVNAKGKPQYLTSRIDRQTGKRVRSYINSTEVSYIRALAQKSYVRRAKKLASKRLRQIIAINKDFEDDEFEILYDELHPARKVLVTPVEQTWDQLVSSWLKKETFKCPYPFEETEYYTEKRERVRSKTERDIGNLLAANDIEYKFEAGLRLDGRMIYPDFTILSRQSRKEVYLEHFGMMDDMNYVDKSVKKIELYEKNGIFLNDRLFITFESGTRDIDHERLKLIIDMLK